MKLLTKNAKYFGAFGLALCGGFLFESLRMDAPTVVQVSTNDNNGGKPLFSFGDEVELNIRPAFSFAPDDHPPAQLAGIASILAAEAEGLALSKQLAERRAAAAAAAAPAAAGLIQPPPAPPSTISFTLKIPASSRSVQIKCASDADAESVVDAIAIATGVDPVGIELAPQRGGGFALPAHALRADMLNDEGVYEIVVHPMRGCKNNNANSRNVKVYGSDPEGRQAKLPTVVVCALGTGRYRGPAIKALQTAVKHFGGDCIPSFHLLSDNMTDVPHPLKAYDIPYRTWPESGLYKFHDVKTALGGAIKEADFFFFMDADTGFNEDTRLIDVGADLSVVEHPMYPRDHMGWCDKPTGQAMCGYPYDRNPRSHAYIPSGVGKFIQTHTGGRGKVTKYLTSTFWYIQSAFWGGKSKFVLPLLDDMSTRVAADIAANTYSMTVQDERYLNHYVWREYSNPDFQIRILSHSYLYPYRDDGFGDWVTKKQRPIIYHGIFKTPGKLTKGEIQLLVKSTNQCIGFFLNPKIGLFGCHGGGGMQGWVVEDKERNPESWPPTLGGGYASFRAATTYGPWSSCMNGDVPEGSPAKITSCRRTEWEEIAWRMDEEGRFVNKKSGLCLNAQHRPPHKREPAVMSACDESNEFQKWKGESIASLKCVQDWCKDKS